METLCWDCKKAIGGCTWADKSKPVDGWDAEKTIVRNESYGDMESYCVKSCPEFERDEKRIVLVKEVIEMLGWDKRGRKYQNSTIKEIEKTLAEKGYNVKYSYVGGYWYELRR
jgi:hypothetical protein